MWWSDPQGRRGVRGPAALCRSLLVALALSGCGFQPLYAPYGGERDGAGDRLAEVRIEPLPDRAGQQLHNFLRDQLNPGGQPARPDYRLNVNLSRRTEKLAFREDETATRANLILNSAFTLHAASDGRVLYSGHVSSIQSYNILNSPYPTGIAEADALERGLRELSEDIKLQLAIYFSTAEAEGP